MSLLERRRAIAFSKIFESNHSWNLMSVRRQYNDESGNSVVEALGSNFGTNRLILEDGVDDFDFGT